MENIDALRRQLEFEMQHLPQYQFLQESDIQRWIDHVLETDPSKAMFHMKRLFQFGGSEIGSLIQSTRNLYAKTLSDIKFSHLTDRDIFAYKYLKTLPEPSEGNGNLLRGKIFEPQLDMIMGMELKQKYGSAIPRPDLVEKIVKAISEEYKWVRVQVDNIWQAGSELILTDYKFPTSSGLNTLLNTEPVMYSSQVTIGKMVAKKLGIEITQTMVSPFDINNTRFINMPVPFSQEFEDEIMDVGTSSYEKLQKGEWPLHAIPKYRLASSSQIPEATKRAMVSVSALRICATEIKSRIDELEASYQPFLDTVQHTNIDDFRIEVGPVNLTAKHKRNFSKPDACLLLREYGVDDSVISPIRNNISKLEKALQGAKIPKELIDKKCYTNDYEVDVSSTRAPKGEQALLLNAVKEDISQKLNVINEVVDSVLEYDSLSIEDGSLEKRQKNQLRTLQNVMNLAPDQELHKKAATLFSQRSPHYGLNNVDNANVGHVNDSLSKLDDIELTNESSDPGTQLSKEAAALNQISHLFRNSLA
ncbi:hypothetical protein [Vibrio anguillarum]|uniref:hypothetical protein n=4 Tax=Vibrio anguillarum TaxID=55601 RepID=UPI000BB46E2E|nr:hypothetical protein [Vibrio anguillarum]ATC60132.1 hypothetical protein CMV05_22285 [Vibrio anguillarum]